MSDRGLVAGMIEVSDNGPVRLVTFNRPQARNAFNFEMYQAVAGALRAAEADDSVHVVVLTGRGSAFSSGQDLGELEAIAAGRAVAASEGGFRELLDVLEGFELPIVAAVNGDAVGLGFTILAHCDLVLLARRARLKLPFVSMGVPPEAASSYLLPARMGWQAAALALLGGDWVSADEAVSCGLALAQFPDDELLTAAVEVAGRIAASPRPALRQIKRLMLAAQAHRYGLPASGKKPPSPSSSHAPTRHPRRAEVPATSSVASEDAAPSPRPP
jgi:enoyl-CoA hydratase/carnithine racemase